MDPKYDGVGNKSEHADEKRSTSSGELEAQHVELDEAESARVLRKVDMRLVPLLSLLYLVSFIDRSNSASETPFLLLSRTDDFIQLVTQRPRE